MHRFLNVSYIQGEYERVLNIAKMIDKYIIDNNDSDIITSLNQDEI